MVEVNALELLPLSLSPVDHDVEKDVIYLR
jgi:hypothetical protein